MSKHANIPIFIAHEGCNNACVFCDQRSITGTSLPANRDIRAEIDLALSTIKEGTDTEIAFFGGSFTGIGTELMTRLCDDAYEYVKQGKVNSIRLSTRPDYIDERILDILKLRGVTDIELGIQSMSDEVLKACKRGHTAEDTLRACRLIKQYGFNLVGQMMIGLPCSALETELETAHSIIEMGADAARIYPTVVFCNTELCDMAQNNEYTPLTNDEAVKRSAAVYRLFRKADIPVLRIGLHASRELDSAERFYAGANHPALGELVISEYFYTLLSDLVPHILETAEGLNSKTGICVYCHESNVSKIIGQNSSNRIRLLEKLQSQNKNITEIKVIGNKVYSTDKITVSAYTLKRTYGYGGR